MLNNIDTLDTMYLQANKDALTIELYSDAVELANPLGASRGKHKIVNIYFSLAELPKGLRSKTENKFLVLSVKSVHLKNYRQVIYKPLLEDLHRLEAGIKVDGKTVKAGLLCHLGDNLESHVISGMSQSFSSGYICRQCHLKHCDLPSIRWEPVNVSYIKWNGFSCLFRFLIITNSLIQFSVKILY
jgi:hypothetical protein